MKRPTMLTKTLVIELARDLGLSAERDVQTIAHRCQHEGFSFLAITLPTLSDSLERGLEAGQLTCPSSFSVHGRLPRFLGGFFSLVFDRRTGRLLDDPCPRAIFAIRQICRFWKKPKMECSEEMNSRATQRFKEVEDELRMLTPLVTREDSTLDTLSRLLWSQVFPLLDGHRLVCCHGPGVTADRYLPNERYRIREWYERAELNFPPDLHAFHNLWWAGEAEGSGGVRDLRIQGLREEPAVRVVFVPKTLSGPRVIAIEPSAMQYMQQAVMRYVVPLLESHRLTARSVHFTDQTINQSRAYQSSIDRSLATLDLKDASDRVHLGLVQRIFKGSGILELLEDTRSLHADLPDGTNVVLHKFASMGSAMCFPVEAMVFYTLVQTALHKQDGKSPTSKSIRKYSRDIDIYGDDIIVPVEYADAVVYELESFGLKVNVHKSFRTSLFRESCGGDFFNGHSVKPVYAREYPHDDRRQWTANTVMSWVSTSDQFYLEGLWETAQAIRDMLEAVLRRRIPRSRVKTHGVGFFSLIFDTDCSWRQDIQGWYQKRVVYTPVKREDRIHDDPAACFNKLLGTTRAQVRRGLLDVEGDPVHNWLPSNDNEALTSLDPSKPWDVEHLSSELNRDLQAVIRKDSSNPSPSSGTSWYPGRARMLLARIDKILEEQHRTAFESSLCSSVKRGSFKSKSRWVTVLT